MLAWGWHPTLALYWLKCIMPMLATDVEPIFYQRWLNRNTKKVFLANWKAISKRKWPSIITQSWKNSRKLTTTIITAFAEMLAKHWQHWQNVGKFADVLPTLPTDGQHWPDLACLLGYFAKNTANTMIVGSMLIQCNQMAATSSLKHENKLV